MTTILRTVKNTYCVIDTIYINGKLIGEQGNLTNRNRYGAKQYNYQGKILNVDLWEKQK